MSRSIGGGAAEKVANHRPTKPRVPAHHEACHRPWDYLEGSDERPLLGRSRAALNDRFGRISVVERSFDAQGSPPRIRDEDGVKPISCCERASYNKTLLRSAIYVSPESTLTSGGFRWQIAVRDNG